MEDRSDLAVRTIWEARASNVDRSAILVVERATPFIPTQVLLDITEGLRDILAPSDKAHD